MKLIVGLGNPGKKYEKTRHNVGFMVLDALASQIFNSQFSVSNKFSSNNFEFQKKVDSEVFKANELILAKPQTFMNESGRAVKSLFDFYKVNLEDLYVVHDDLDIKLSEYKIQKGVGPKLHYGISSIEEKLVKKDFWRVRVGVDNRDPENRLSGEEYVLQNFTDTEMATIEEVIDKVTTKLLELIKA